VYKHKGVALGYDIAPLWGWLSFVSLTRGFTPGYMLSALRACCRAKRLFALHK